MNNVQYIKGRGAQINPSNPFHNFVEESQLLFNQEEWELLSNTDYIEVYPKTILNKVTSPDIGMAYSLNPY